MSTQPFEASQVATDQAERPTSWRRLTEPHASIQEVGERRLARLLSGLAFTCVIGSSLSLPVIGMASLAALEVMAVVMLCFVPAYLISRTRHYRRSAVVLVLLTIIGPTAAAYVGEVSSDVVVAWVVWCIMAVMLGSLYLSTRVMYLVVALCIAAALVLYAGPPEMSVEGLLSVIMFLVVVSAMTLIINQHRNAIEEDRIRVEQRRDELSQLNRSMETMLQVISHDLKEPLRAIQNFSQMVEKSYADKLDDKGQDFLRRVVRGARRMRELLDDLLQLSRAQRIEQPKTPVPGVEIVADALGRLEEIIAESGAEIRVADDLPAFRVARSWASGAIYNLIENAIKHATEGTRPVIEVAAYHGSRGLGLVVKDRGPGVEPEHRERIFELFQRAVSRDVPGTGAGLAIVRQIAERHGGAAWVEPRGEGGSAFYIAFQGPGAAIQRL